MKADIYTLKGELMPAELDAQALMMSVLSDLETLRQMALSDVSQFRHIRLPLDGARGFSYWSAKCKRIIESIESAV